MLKIRHIILYVLFCCVVYADNDVLCKNSRQIIVDSKYNNTCVAVGTNKLHCGNLKTAFSVKNLSDTCMWINDNQILSERVTRTNIDSLAILGNSSNTTVFCNNAENNTTGQVGINITNSSNFVMKNIQFSQCGMQYYHKFSNLRVGITTAFHLAHIKNIDFVNVHITESLGYGITMHECNGRVNFTDIKITHNGNTSYGDLTSGGGIYMEYSEPTFKNVIIFNKCSLISNTGARDPNTELSQGENYVPFGRGVGICIFLKGFSSRNIISVVNSLFEQNKGLWGGGLFVSFQGNSTGNKIVIKNSTFIDNKAKLSGGGVRISSARQGAYHSNVIEFVTCNFTRNAAVFGGGFSHFRDYLTKQKMSTFTNCTFINNSAVLGAAIYLERVTIVFRSIYVANHSLWWEDSADTLGKGAMYAYDSRLIFYGISHVEWNNGTAFILDNSHMKPDGTLYFVANRGVNGGALSLYEHSILNLTNKTNLFFLGNHARKGGAIYVKVTGPQLSYFGLRFIQSYSCFCSYVHYNAWNITFSYNTADLGGDDVFATTLAYCNKTSFKGFNSMFVTDPIKIVADSELWPKIYPGKTITANIYLTDELGNNVSELISIFVHDNPLVMLKSHRYFVQNNKINITFLGCENQNFTINITFANKRYKLLNLKLDSCPFGYFLNKTKCLCNHAMNIKKGIVCFGDKVYISKNRYGYYDKDGDEATQVCPLGYCKGCKNSSCLYEKFKPYNRYQQCASGRNQNSTLCSQCANGTNLLFGCEACTQKCKSWYWELILIPVMTFGLVFFLLCFNCDIYTTLLSSVMYFYQVIGLHLVPTQKKVFIGIVMSMLDFQGVSKFFSFCLFPGWNDVDKLAFNYVIPLCMIFWLAVVYAIGSWRRSFFLNKSKCFRAFALIVLLAYSDITRVTFSLLLPVKMHGILRPYYYATYQYFQNRHLIYGLIAVVVAVFFVVLWPLFLALSPGFCGWFVKKTICIKPVLDNYRYCFKDDYLWFASFYFFARILLLGMYAISFLIEEVEIKACITMVSICIFGFYSMFMPYKPEHKYNYYMDLYVLFSISVIGIFSNAKATRRYNVSDTYEIIVFIIMLLPFIILFLRICYIYIPILYAYFRKLYNRYIPRLYACFRNVCYRC